MANTFRSASSSDIGTVEATIYTVPVATTTVIIGFILANKHSQMVAVDIAVGGVVLGKGLPVPAGSSLSALDGKLVLGPGEAVTVTSDTASSIDVILSVMEIS
jgi:hypothetical protein